VDCFICHRVKPNASASQRTNHKLMSSTSDDYANARAHQACASCRKQKRKCDKLLPACSLCTRLGRTCDYHEAPSSASSDEFVELRQKVQELEARLESKQAGNGVLSPNNRLTQFAVNTFPAVFFLDSEIYQESRFDIPRPAVSVPEEVLELLKEDDIGGMVESYFSTIHKWLPIVSRKRLFLTLSSPNACQGAELALLLLCMKLITHMPPDDSRSAQNPLYLTAKTFFTVLESSASMTVQLVQSALLLCAYEVGHGIYPAAFLSAGRCTRLVYALGLHDRKGSPQVIKRPVSWAEQEELRRVWWGTLLLDR
jgi:Fungal specific transcription factor domain/Fungal Zn(2)-Cys(6) binuclear cluster domain